MLQSPQNLQYLHVHLQAGWVTYGREANRNIGSRLQPTIILQLARSLLHSLGKEGVAMVAFSIVLGIITFSLILGKLKKIVMGRGEKYIPTETYEEPDWEQSTKLDLGRDLTDPSRPMFWAYASAGIAPASTIAGLDRH